MSMCSTVQPVSSCPQSRLAAASLGAVLISLIVPYRTVPGWDGAGLAVPVGERPSQFLCRPRVAWPVGAQGAAKLLALLVIVAGIVTFTGDSNPAH
ncbi:hypothetical protein BbifJCM1254_08850 [Bifidobacterium bifidum JCM 1254]|nr:hypothetical protein BbifJCM1254_08850 [Bifidobacterium bifidum JCM 1254]